LQLEKAIQSFEGQPLTQGILMGLLKEYRWPHNKIRELEKQGILAPVKRGLYITGPSISSVRPSAFLLANHIYGPSYISLEAALSHWGLIPEKVAGISSMTTGLSKTVRTPAGRFHYIRTRLPYYSFGIRQVVLSPQQVVLMASPEKAICDLIVTRSGLILRSRQQTMDFLVEDMRMETSALRDLDQDTIRRWMPGAPKKTSIDMLNKTLEAL
jgi:hypothetical protein